MRAGRSPPAAHSEAPPKRLPLLQRLAERRRRALAGPAAGRRHHLRNAIPPIFALTEALVSERLKRRSAEFADNRPEICALDPQSFAKQVIEGQLAFDGGNWVQPLFKRRGGAWHLCKLEVLYRMSDATRVPFPAFVNFVAASSDQSPNPDPELRRTFCGLAIRSMQRIDELLSKLGAVHRRALAKARLLTALNVTAKQLREALRTPLTNSKLMAIEETEYDDEPHDISELRQTAWRTFGAYSLDDVKPTLSDIFGGMATPPPYEAPRTPQGQPFKPLATVYRHDFAFARRFIEDFKVAVAADPTAEAEIKLDEEFCCYLIGVGHAPFAREAMRRWSEDYPEASAVIRAAGVRLIQEALLAGMGICFEVSFEDSDVQWLFEALPELEGCLLKQGGLSGSMALPSSFIADDLLTLEG